MEKCNIKCRSFRPTDPDSFALLAWSDQHLQSKSHSRRAARAVGPQSRIRLSASSVRSGRTVPAAKLMIAIHFHEDFWVLPSYCHTISLHYCCVPLAIPVIVPGIA